MKKIGLVLMVVLLVSACGGHRRGDTASSSQKALNNTLPVLLLEAVDFSEDVEVNKVKVECSMLEKLTASILDSAKAYQVNIDAGKDASGGDDGYLLRVTYVNVIPHRWVFPSIRPSSSATVKAEVVKDNEIVKSISKPISSAVALGACDRLEKIAVAGGRYIAKWASNQRYE